MGLLHQVLSQVLGGRGAPAPKGAAEGDFGGALSGHRSPIAMALLALLASKQLKGSARGTGSVLQEVFSGGGRSGISGAFSSCRDGLGGILGNGLTGSALVGGLGELLRRFSESGHGTIVQSWVGHGANAPVSPDQLERIIGSGDVSELTRQAGLGRNDLLAQLAAVLPDAVDKLTPHGRLPTEAEWTRNVQPSPPQGDAR